MQEIIITGLIVTIVGGILVAVILGFAGPWTRPWTRRMRARITSPVRVAFAPEPIYSYEQGVFAAVPTTYLSTTLSTALIDQARTTPHAAYVCPTPFVLTLHNISDSTDPRDVYIREIHFNITEYTPLQRALQNMAVVQATTVQAGGRILEGHFTIVFHTTRSTPIPLIRSAAAERHVAPRPIHLQSGTEYQVGLTIRPVVAGRYRFDVSIEIDEGGETKRISVAHNTGLVECSDLNWVKETIRTFNWMDPDEREPSVAPALQERWAEYHQGEHERAPQLPPGRRVVVEGDMYGQREDLSA